jgi:ribonuclease Z
MMENMFTWDIAGRIGQTDTRGFHTKVTEFDYKLENQVVYQENGVTIRAWPAIHAIDGPVSYGLEWNGLKFVFGSDTFPNKWFNEYARNADLAIHECFVTVPDFISKWRATPEAALQVGTQIHTAPEAFGKVMSEIRPRMAVAYHFFKDFDTTGPILERIRKTYDGPLSLAEDLMVWNVTKDEIRVRMALAEEHVWNPPMADPAIPPDPSEMGPFAEDRLGGVVPGYSDFIVSGRWEGVDDVLREIYREASEALGREFPYPGDEEGDGN